MVAMAEKILAAFGLAACVLLLVRMLLPAPGRYRLDAAGRRTWSALRGAGAALLNLRRWRERRRHSKATAEAAIERARRAGRWDGNVYKPDAFERDDGAPARRPRKPH